MIAISDELGVEKPDRQMFLHALESQDTPDSDWPNVAMVGNNLARYIWNAKSLGLVTIWLVWKPRYPIRCADAAETPEYQVSTAADLTRLLVALAGGHDLAEWTHPQQFPWQSNEIV